MQRSTIAAANNAEWCATVWRLHGLPVEQECGTWFATSRAPPLYPNVVTVDPDADPEAQLALVRRLASDLRGVALKDSFAKLALRPLGFAVLFEASWLWRDGTSNVGQLGTEQWRAVRSVQDFRAWHGAWMAGGGGVDGVLNAALLDAPGVTVLARIDPRGRCIAGATAYRSRDALGLTNVFGHSDGLLDALARDAPGLPIVRYESGGARVEAQRQGFLAVGPLTVWIPGR